MLFLILLLLMPAEYDRLKSNSMNNPSYITPASTHSRTRRYADEHVQIPVSSMEFHCVPLRSSSKMAFIAARLGTRGR